MKGEGQNAGSLLITPSLAGVPTFRKLLVLNIKFFTLYLHQGSGGLNTETGNIRALPRCCDAPR